MHSKRLVEIVEETTAILEPTNEVDQSKTLVVDCHFRKVGIDKVKAESRQREVAALMHQYPNQDRLKLGPSYIELAGTLFDEDQEIAIRLMALGKYLELWDIITPDTVGAQGDDADRLAHAGLITIDAYTG